MKLTGGQALVEQLIREGVTDVFGIPGVQLDWAVDALCQAADRIRFVVPRHEQATSYMADGYARTTEKEGVCMMVPGPGMLNALAGLSTAYACNSRVLFIAGQIPSDMIGRGLGMLHEIPDQSGILKSLTKWHGMASKPEDVPGLVHEAFVQLRSGRPRPVALEFPPDVLQAEGEMVFHDAAPHAPTPAPADAVAKAAALLAGARNPVIHAGGGAAASRAGEALRVLAERLQAPVIMTEGARGVLSSRHPLALSTLGGRAVLPHADVVLVAGSRFVDALGRSSHAGPNCQFIYLNLDEAALGEPRQAGVRLNADVRLGLEALAAALPADAPPRASRAADMDKVRAWADHQAQEILPQADYLGALRGALKDDDILVSELTQVGYYSTVAYPAYAPGAYLTPGYQGTLGYGFPTALGASAGNPRKRVVSITGDGGFGWGLQDLATAVKYQLNMTTVVFHDGRFGNVQRIQRRTFGREFAVELTNPDFQMLAKAFGLRSARVDSPEGLADALKAATAAGGPWLIEVLVGEMASPWPLIHPFVPPLHPPAPNPLGEPGGQKPGDPQ